MNEKSPNLNASSGLDQPLGLKVHSIPVPGQDTSRTISGRWKMIAILLVCAAPVLLSYFTYYVIRPDGRRNFGELINPQRPLPSMRTEGLDGKAGELRALKDQWLLISVGNAACEQACQQRLYYQRQIRESLGREKDRLDSVWLINDAATVEARIRPGLVSTTVLRVPADAVAQWLQPAAGQRLEDHIYLVDPLGNWMMRFPATMNADGAAKAKRDLDRLLRASASWDKEGR